MHQEFSNILPLHGACKTHSDHTLCVMCILDYSEYFRDLPPAAKRYLQNGVQRKIFAKHELLYCESERNDFLYIFVSGGVKVYKSTLSGRQQIHKLVATPGELVACEDLFMDVSGSSAEAIEDTVLCGLHRDYLQEASKRHPEISDVLMRVMASKLNAYIRHVSNLGSITALEKTSSYLIFRSKAQSQHKGAPGFVHESLTRMELAEMLGITQRTLIRSLKELEDMKVIALVKDGYMIHDLDRLSSLAESE